MADITKDHRVSIIPDYPSWRNRPDMSFGEDRSRIRKGHADANFAVVRRMALSLLKNERSQRVGVKTKRLTAGWNDDYLEQVLFGT